METYTYIYWLIIRAALEDMDKLPGEELLGLLMSSHAFL
jgi:hypothetical protein